MTKKDLHGGVDWRRVVFGGYDVVGKEEVVWFFR